MVAVPRILLIWAGLYCVRANDADVTPMTKVVQLLGDLKVQLEQDGQKEAENYNEYNHWCDLEAQDSKVTISDTKAKIEDIEAFLQEQEAFREKLASEIEETAAEVASNEADLQDAKTQRSNEHKVYMEAETEYVQSIQQLELAIETMQKKQPGGGPKPAADLFAVATTLKHALERNPDFQLNGAEEQTLDNFFRTTQMMQTGQAPQMQPMSFLQTGQMMMAPDYGDYQQQGGGVTTTLQSILDKQKVNRDAAMQGEQKAANAFSLVEQSLTTEISDGNKAMTEKKSQVAKSEETCSKKQQELDAAKQLNAETTQYLNDVIAACEQKAREFKERTKLRSDEITAVQEAIQILSSAQAKDLAGKGSIGFLQIRSTTHKVLRRLQNSGSTALSFLAVRMQNKMISLQNGMQTAGADPFKDVRKMIQEMIVRLLNEAAEEAEHKGWCDTEMAKSAESKKQKEKDIKTLKNQIDEMEAQKAQLIDEMQQLEKDMAEMEQMTAEATTVRGKEKQQALISIKEYADAQQLIGNAMTVLQEYYAKKNQASLAQVGESQSPQTPSMDGRPDAPGIWEEGQYKADDTAASGVLGILEIAQSDFAKLQSETEMQEQTSAREYQALMNDSQVKKAVFDKDLEYKQNTKVKLESSLQRAKSDLAGYEKELEAVEAYIEKLKPSCVQTDSFEDRKARREAEIKSLQEALAILNGEAIP
jgi:hypothetical protein